MRAVFFFNVLSCCILCVLCVYALLRGNRVPRLRRNALDFSFIVLCIVLALGIFGNAFFISSHTSREAFAWYRYFAFTWYLSPGLFLIFCLLLCGYEFKAWHFIIFIPGLMVFVAHVILPRSVMLGVSRVPMGWHAIYNHNSFWHWLNVINYSGLTLAAIVVLLRKGLGSREELIHKRAMIVLLSIVPTFLGTFTTGFLIRFFGIRFFPPMLPIFLSVLVIGLAIALYHYDLLALTSTSVAERILSSVYDAVVLVDTDGTIIDNNLRGPAHDTAIQQPISVLIPAAVDSQSWFSRHLAEGEAAFEELFVFENNRTAPASMSIRGVFNAGNTYSGYVITAHDLSAEKDLSLEVDRRLATTAALRSIEANFTRAFRASPAGMLISERNTWLLLDANNAVADIFKLPLNEIVGASFSELGLHVDAGEIENLLNALEKGEISSSDEISLYRRDESRVVCLVSASPLQFRGRDAALFTFVDITEQDRLRNDLARAQKLESIGILAGGIAHDFNNIMTAIMGNVSLVRMSLDEDNELYQAVSRAEAACMRARELSRQLLTFSKGGDPNPEATNIVSLVREAVRMATAGSNVVSTFTVESSLPAALVDPGQMIQCFNNIAINAVQAMEQGGTLFVSIKRIRAEDLVHRRNIPVDLEKANYLTVEFRDTGPGIDPRYIDRIFDPYVSYKAAGSGLGLSICYSILKRHKGGISVKSKPGSGAVFTVFIRETTAPVKDVEQSVIRMGKGSILVMDDEYGVRSVMDNMLRRLGYEPTTCPDGKDALDILRSSRAQGKSFSAVLLDLTVPGGMGGLEAAKGIRAMDPDIPLYVMSGYSDDPIISGYRSFGFDGVLHKPFGVEELSRMLSNE